MKLLLNYTNGIKMSKNRTHKAKVLFEELQEECKEGQYQIVDNTT